ncbi:MAG: tRNA (adenosine(37)-N6)-threonylcarbamoyltransferase complex transferase subunit TsaD [Phycisphaeraceae bacterium]|nr:tRNA (adenosine(37)-N6)-threonylcarbamoyltransferase complex transferase subunit TsaD [Phycisphaeraceae bacterium]
MTTVLGIETSCDETAAAVVVDGGLVKSNVIASQHDLHVRYGGVVPEIASRAHLEKIMPVVRQALDEAGVDFADIDAVAVGNRPGLIGSLLVGVSAAAALAWALGKPLLGVDHVRAHLYAATMTPGSAPAPAPGSDQASQASPAFPCGAIHPGSNPGSAPGNVPETRNARPAGQLERSDISRLFPALGLVVSGGHTSLYFMTSPLELTLLGRTIDDAVGEAYDKAAVILDVGYPGGPKLDKLAQSGNAKEGPKLPRSLLGPESLDFSFSGLKTALLYAVRGQPVGRGEQAHFTRGAEDLTAEQKANLAAAFQKAAVGSLLAKIERALEHLGLRDAAPRALLVGGGVSANSLLRQSALELGRQRGLKVCLPPMSLCLDNAAMIAGLGYEHFRLGEFAGLDLPAVATVRS